MIKKNIIVALIILVGIQSCTRNKAHSKVILPNGEIREEMTIKDLKKIDMVQFSQNEGFLFQNYIIITEDPYMNIYTEAEIKELEKATIKGFRKKVNLNGGDCKVFEDSLINIFKVTKTKKINSNLTVYSDNIGCVFSILKKQGFSILTISNKNEILIPPL